jgi:hypothetical protein
MGTLLRIILILIVIGVIWQIIQAALGLLVTLLLIVGLCAVISFVYRAMTYKEKI